MIDINKQLATEAGRRRLRSGFGSLAELSSGRQKTLANALLAALDLLDEWDQIIDKAGLWRTRQPPAFPVHLPVKDLRDPPPAWLDAPTGPGWWWVSCQWMDEKVCIVRVEGRLAREVWNDGCTDTVEVYSGCAWLGPLTPPDQPKFTPPVPLEENDFGLKASVLVQANTVEYLIGGLRDLIKDIERGDDNGLCTSADYHYEYDISDTENNSVKIKTPPEPPEASRPTRSRPE